MATVEPMTQRRFLTATQAKNYFGVVIKDAVLGRKEVWIDHNGAPEVVVISRAQYEAMSGQSAPTKSKLEDIIAPTRPRRHLAAAKDKAAARKKKARTQAKAK